MAISMWVYSLNLWKRVKINRHKKGNSIWRMYNNKFVILRQIINIMQERAIAFSKLNNVMTTGRSRES